MPNLTEDERVQLLRLDIQAAEEVAQQESIDNAELYKYYRAKKMGNEVQGRSQIVDTTVFETVEWMLPAIMDAFSEENGFWEFEPHGPEDVEPAAALTNLTRYQFWRQTDTGRKALRQAIKKALLYRPGGIIKYCWEKEEKRNKKSYTGLSPTHMMMFPLAGGQVQATGIGGDGGYTADVLWTDTEFDGPRFYSVPDGEFLRHPNARDIETSPFVAHRVRITVDELRRRRKAYPDRWKNIERAIEENKGTGTQETYSESVALQQDNLGYEQEPVTSEPRRELQMYECYVRMDTDGDGLLEDRVMCLIGSVLVRDERNEYEHPTFVKVGSVDDIDKFSGIPISEMVMDIQRLRTFLLRQMVDNMAQANNSRKVYDPTRINQADLMMNVPGAPIRVKPGYDVRTVITELVTQPFNPVAFSVLEYVTNLSEQRTGVTKANKGVADQYNQTFHGQLAALNQASMRIKAIATIMAEGLNPMFRAMVLMNKKFLTQDTYVRLENKFLEITPDDLEGRMDLSLHVALGQSSRQQNLINMQMLLSTYGQIQANTQLPMLDGNNLPHIMREMVKSMGYKAQDQFLPLILQQKPEDANAAIAELQTQNQMMGGNSGGPGGQTVGSLAGEGGGGTATPNAAGAGLPSPAIQRGAGQIFQ